MEAAAAIPPLPAGPRRNGPVRDRKGGQGSAFERALRKRQDDRQPQGDPDAEQPLPPGQKPRGPAGRKDSAAGGHAVDVVV